MTTREESLRSLAAMAAADGRVAKRERRLIDANAARWGLTPADVEEALRAADAGLAKVTLPAGAGEQQELLDALVDVAAADDVVGEAERALLHAYAAPMGLSQDAVDALVAAALRRRAAAKQRAAAATGPGSDRARAVAEAGASLPGAPKPEAPGGAPPERKVPVARLASAPGAAPAPGGAGGQGPQVPVARLVGASAPATSGGESAGPPLSPASLPPPAEGRGGAGSAGAADLLDLAQRGATPPGEGEGARVTLVAAGSGGLIWPNLCACCLAPGDGARELTSTYTEVVGDVRRTQTTRVRVPYCQACLAHEATDRTRRLLAGVAFVLVAGAALWLGVRGFSSSSVLFAQGARTYVALAALALGAWTAAAGAARLLLPAPAAPGPHRTEGAAVRVSQGRDEVRFSFAHPHLAAVVAAANFGECAPYRGFTPWGQYGAGLLFGLRGRPAARGGAAGAAIGAALLVTALFAWPPGDLALLEAAQRSGDVAAFDAWLARFPISRLRAAALTGRRGAALRAALRGTSVHQVLKAFVEHGNPPPDAVAEVAARLRTDADRLRDEARSDADARQALDATVRRLPAHLVAPETLAAWASSRFLEGAPAFLQAMEWVEAQRGDAAAAAVRALLDRDRALLEDVAHATARLDRFEAMEPLLACVRAAARQPGVEDAAWRGLAGAAQVRRFAELFPDARAPDRDRRLHDLLARFTARRLREQGSGAFLDELQWVLQHEGEAGLMAVRERLRGDPQVVEDVARTVAATDTFASMEGLLAHVPAAVSVHGVEEAVWRAVRTPADVDRYLALYPDGRFRDQAERRRIELEFAADRHHGVLPPSQASGRSGIAGKAVYVVRNSTGHDLHLSFLGPDARTITIGVGRTATIELANGTYRIRARVDDASVTPFHGEENLVDGRFETEFVIRTTFDPSFGLPRVR